MHKRTLIKNAVLVNEGEVYEGALLIQNHHIEQVLRGRDAMPTQPADQVIDAQGAYLLPGVIDSHVHLREPGYTHKGDMRT
jgi:dihydroorotase